MENGESVVPLFQAYTMMNLSSFSRTEIETVFFLFNPRIQVVVDITIVTLIKFLCAVVLLIQ
jgi:hypothetical protein